jgi:hypothetical protein
MCLELHFETSGCEWNIRNPITSSDIKIVQNADFRETILNKDFSLNWLLLATENLLRFPRATITGTA